MGENIIGVSKKQRTKIDCIAQSIRDDCDRILRITEKRWINILIRVMHEDGKNYDEIADKLSSIGYRTNSECVRKRLSSMSD